ncbi:hypothetical protein [Pseudomonas fluorescens]|uniref:Uncharacterized protein n=1 Tax=Pseudomonas fluorescens TaxID=294 RepID=A0A5E7AJQ4_PSEFL|nr:hypothetical protein [Pseudomonas fluorescens]VVN78110.1 hypothetical protein PS723_00869 [Pseudomonas fluorescens]
MTQRIDRIALLKNCPVMGEEIRRAITESRKDPLPTSEADDDDTEELDADIEPIEAPAGGKSRKRS